MSACPPAEDELDRLLARIEELDWTSPNARKIARVAIDLLYEEIADR